MIGIFDSGSGGLTVLAAIRAQAPLVDIVYLGDLANAPYGLKNQQTLEQLTFSLLRRLRAQGATYMVSACNSISAAVILPMLDLLIVEDSRMTEMVSPTVDALRPYKHSRIAILCTQATAESGIYQKACAGAGLHTATIPCPRLAGLIEKRANRSQLAKEVYAAVDALEQAHSDIAVFGCTHYPLVRKQFEDELHRRGLRIKLFDPAWGAATHAITNYGAAGSGKTIITITKESATFRKFCKNLCGIKTVSVLSRIPAPNTRSGLKIRI